MATVKGDVHDIGKNIVGVVLQCNNYEVIDLGVMVPAQKILDTASEIGADIIGLSGLITPSLDEMVNFAVEMQRQGLRDPAADRRRDHLARAHRGQGGRRKYDGPVVWVKDASRSVPDRWPRCSATTQRPQLLGRREGRLRLAARAARRQARPADAHAASRPATTARRSTWDGYDAAGAQGAGRPRARGLRPRRAARLHRLAAVLQRLGDEGQVPRHPQQPDHRARPPASCTTTRRRCSTRSSRRSG